MKAQTITIKLSAREIQATVEYVIVIMAQTKILPMLPPDLQPYEIAIFKAFDALPEEVKMEALERMDEKTKKAPKQIMKQMRKPHAD